MFTQKPIRIFLERLQRTFHIDADYIARGGAWLLAGKATGVLFAFFLSLLYARFVPKTVFGEYKYVFSLFGTFAFIALPGVGIALTRSVARGFENSFRRGFRLIFLTSWLIAAAGLALSVYFYLHGDLHTALLVACTGLAMPLLEGTGSWKGYFDAKKNFKQKAIASVVQDLCVFILILIAIGIIHFIRPPVLIQTLVLVFAVIGGQAFINIGTSRALLSKIPRNAPDDQTMIKTGLHMTAATIPSAIANYIDGVLIYTYLGPIELAIYAFALIPANQMKELLNMLSSLAFPKFAQQSEQELRRNLPKRALRASILTTVAVLAYIVAAPTLYQILFPIYMNSVAYSQVFALSLLLSPLALLGTAIDASGSTKKIYVYRTVPQIVQIFALAMLIPSYGLWGAIAGKIIGRVFNQLFLLGLFRW